MENLAKQKRLSLIELYYFFLRMSSFLWKHSCPLLSLKHTLNVFSMNNHFMNITISVAIHLAQYLIESI